MTIIIKPHHLLDVFKLYNRGVYPLTPDLNYEHDFYLIGNLILDGKVDMVSLTIHSDDICKPCKHNKTGICMDSLEIDSFDKKEEYNRFIDKNLLQQFQLEEDLSYDLDKLLNLMTRKLSLELISEVWCYNSKEDNELRFVNTLNGIEKYIQSKTKDCRSE